MGCSLPDFVRHMTSCTSKTYSHPSDRRGKTGFRVKTDSCCARAIQQVIHPAIHIANNLRTFPNEYFRDGLSPATMIGSRTRMNTNQIIEMLDSEIALLAERADAPYKFRAGAAPGPGRPEKARPAGRPASTRRRSLPSGGA